MSSKVDYLESVEVFRDLTSAEVESIGQQTHMMHHDAGHLLFLPDDKSEALYILKEGRVELYRMSSEGRRVVVATLHPGAIFGQMSLVGQRLHQTYAQCLDNAVVCVWSRADVEKIILDKPRVALRLVETLGQRLIQVEERLEEVTFKRIPARIASLLIELSVEQGDQGIINGYTHQHLADILGTYRETVTQTLNDFKGEDLIQISRKRIEILNVTGLRNHTEA